MDWIIIYWTQQQLGCIAGQVNIPIGKHGFCLFIGKSIFLTFLLEQLHSNTQPSLWKPRYTAAAPRMANLPCSSFNYLTA